MPALKIGIQLASLRLPLRKALSLAGQLGATGIEIDARGEIRPRELGQTGLREVRRLLAEFELRVVAVGFRTRRGYDSADELDRRVAATKEAMKFAADLGAPVVINTLGRIPAQADSPEWNCLTQSLADIGDYGHRVGCTLAGATGQEPPEDFLRLIGALPEHSIGVDLEPANLIIHGHDPLSAVESLAPHILHVHARDAVRDRSSQGGQEVPLGQGRADWPALLGALEEKSYRGYFTISREQSADPQYEIGEAVKYLRNL